MSKKMFWMVTNSVGSILGVCYRFVRENPIISLQLLCVGFLTVLYPQFCFKVFLSPVVVYTVFFLTALLSIGQRQQQEKDGAKITRQPIHEVSHLTKESIHEETKTRISSKEYVEYVEERTVVKNVEQAENEGFSIEDVRFGDSDKFHDGFVGSKEIHDREVENDVYGDHLERMIVPLDEVMVPDFQRDYTKTVHFSDIVEVRRTQLDVIFEEGEEEEQNHAQDLTPRKLDTDDSEDDDALLSVSPKFENNEDEDQRKVRLEEFFSLTLQSTWKPFAQDVASKNYSSDEDDDDTQSSSEASGDSLGRLGPLVYEVRDPQQSHEKETNSPRESSSPRTSTGGESPVDFHFTWTEEDEVEEKESLFEIVHSGDAQSTSEEENLIEIALSDKENPELKAVKGIEAHNHEVQHHQEKDIKPHGPEEENLIEIDLSAEKVKLPEENEERSPVHKEVSDLSEDGLSANIEDSTSVTQLMVEEIQASEVSESGKNCEENHEIEEARKSSAGS